MAMLSMMRIDVMRVRHHGADSTLQLLEERDETLSLLLTLSNGFVLTRKYDTGVGAYVDKLTVKLSDADRKAAFLKTDVVNLVIGTDDDAVETRYRLEDRQDTRQLVDQFGFANCVMVKNERTEIVVPVVP